MCHVLPAYGMRWFLSAGLPAGTPSTVDQQADAQQHHHQALAIAEDIADGDLVEKADMIPFFHGKTEWRNSDIAFEYTKDEWEELQKCALDPVYFVENYCTFLTDKGRRTVTLRPY